MVDILSWLSSNVQVIGILVAIFSAIAGALWQAWRYASDRRREANQRQFEAYHRLVKELVSPEEESGAMYADRQSAVVFELRHFPRYYEFTVRMLKGLKKKAESAPSFPCPALTQVTQEIQFTLDFISNRTSRRT